MSSDLDDLFAELEDAGVQDSYLQRLKDATAASPLRKENKDLHEQVKAHAETASRYRSAALASQFQAIGIKAKPDALKIPDDLDPLDESKMREWAVDMGLADPVEPTTPDEQAAHQRIAGASEGAGTPPPNAARDEILATNDEAEFWAKAKATGVAKST